MICGSLDGLSIEQEIDLTNVPEDELFELLVLTYKVPYWEAYDAELKGWDRVVNWLRIQDAKIARKEGWAVAYANFTADVVNAPAGAVQGWITGEHWRTGQELAWWEHILGIVDVIPGEALAKAGITALVIKIGDKAFDLTKVTSATRNFILASKSAGLKLVVKSTNEIILYSAKGTKEIGRFLNGVLQDIYWVYGGDKVLAKLAGIRYIVDDSKNIFNGSLEIVESGGKTGIRRVGEKLWTKIDEVIGDFQGKIGTYYDVTVTYKTTRERVGVSFMDKDILELHLNIPENLQGQGIGAQIVKQAIAEDTPRIIKGWWKKRIFILMENR